MEIPSPQLLPPTQKHKLTTTFAPSIFTQEEFEIYKTYQIAIHQDLPEDVTEKGYTRFLCNTPLMDITKPRNNKPFNGYGSFHLQYRIDGKLIGVSVVDIVKRHEFSLLLLFTRIFAFIVGCLFSTL
jgi:arginine-tRNA-protein transferase